jgi:hypothetical protein
MQSIAPTIIRHYLPLDFSNQLLDSHRSPRRSFVPKDDNPLQNIKLRALDRSPAPDIVLTFTNKSNKQFQPKKQLAYRQLFKELHEEAEKMQIMQRVAAVVEEQKPKEKRQRTSVSRKSAENGLYRTATSEAETRKGMSRSARRIYSSINFRQGKVVIQSGIYKSQRSDKDDWSSTNNSPARTFLKIRGSKAPDAEIVDHLRRNASHDEYHILNRHGQR